MYHELRKRGTSAADLKFLQQSRRGSFRNFKSKSGTRIINLLVPLCFRSSCQRVLQCITNFGSGALGLGARAGAASGGPSPSRPKRVPFVQQARQLPHSIGPNDASAGSIARAVPAFGRTKGEKKVKLASTLT